jgi:hypothetical protein
MLNKTGHKKKYNYQNLPPKASAISPKHILHLIYHRVTQTTIIIIVIILIIFVFVRCHKILKHKIQRRQTIQSNSE